MHTDLFRYGLGNELLQGGAFHELKHLCDPAMMGTEMAAGKTPARQDGIKCFVPKFSSRSDAAH